MLGMSGMKLAILGLAGLAIVTIIGFAAVHYNGLVADLAVSRANEATLELAVEVQVETIAAAVENADDWKDAYSTLQAHAEVVRGIAAEAQQEQERLNALFAKHNLAELAGAKPGLIERRLNDGSARLNCMFERASGGIGNQDCTD